jgi:hypothetical protein
MGLKIYTLQDNVSKLNTRIAFLEYKIAPHLEFIEIMSEIDPAEDDDFTPHKVIIEPSPNAD